MSHRYLSAKAMPPGVMTALARRAEWHWMLTATGFIVMCVAASSTCTRNAVERPPSPCGPMPSALTASRQLAPRSCAPSGSAQSVPERPRRGDLGEMHAQIRRAADADADDGRRADAAAAFDHAVDDEALDRRRRRRPGSASAGTSRSRSPILSGSSRSRPFRRAREKSKLMIGTRSPHEVCSFLRVIGCTTEERSGCSRVARSQPRRIASFNATPSTRHCGRCVTL